MSKLIKFVATTRQTEKQEREFIATLQSFYEEAQQDIEVVISRAYAKYGVDGKLTPQQMAILRTFEKERMSRSDALIKEVDQRLTSLNRGTPQKVAAFLTAVYLLNRKDTANTINNVLRLDVGFSLPPREAIYRSALNPLSKLSLSDNAVVVKQKIRRSITTSIQQGENLKKMSNRIAKDLESNANNAARVARTETTRNMNQGRLDTFKEAQELGIKLNKVWLSADDSNRTRKSHLELSGTSIPMDKEFVNGLMYPGDPSGSADEVINCRCTLITEILD